MARLDDSTIASLVRTSESGLSVGRRSSRGRSTPRRRTATVAGARGRLSGSRRSQLGLRRSAGTLVGRLATVRLRTDRPRDCRRPGRSARRTCGRGRPASVACRTAGTLASLVDPFALARSGASAPFAVRARSRLRAQRGPQVAERPAIGREQERRLAGDPERGIAVVGAPDVVIVVAEPCPRASCTARRAARWAPSACRSRPGRPCRSRRYWGGRSASASGSRASSGDRTRPA